MRDRVVEERDRESGVVALVVDPQRDFDRVLVEGTFKSAADEHTPDEDKEN